MALWQIFDKGGTAQPEQFDDGLLAFASPADKKVLRARLAALDEPS